MPRALSDEIKGVFQLTGVTNKLRIIGADVGRTGQLTYTLRYCHYQSDFPLVIHVNARVISGKIGIFFVADDLVTVLSTPQELSTFGSQTAFIEVDPAPNSGWLVFRNEGCFSSEFEITSAKAFRGLPSPQKPLAEFSADSSIRLSELVNAFAQASNGGNMRKSSPPESETPSGATERFCNDQLPALPELHKLDIVPVDQLAARLGFREPLCYPAPSKQKISTEWRMEVDDAPIFRYLYRNFRPHRHLEFGTWQGAGALYCLQESSATIWTINLPDGEVRSDGTRAYERDDGMNIGQLYREEGLGNRVCQIFCDSQEWDISNYPTAFFDSVLIDGGHSPDTVTADTSKALKLLRPGGLCLWHDFCPDSAVLLTQLSSRGVVEAVLKNWKMINCAMKDLFWIQPSYILLGVAN